MKFGIRAHNIKAAGLKDLSAKCAGLGIENIQLALAKSFPDFKRGSFTPLYARKIRDAFSTNGISVAVLGAYINCIHPDKDVRKSELDFFKEQLRFAKFIGADMVGLETSSMEGADKEYAYGCVLESMRELTEYAEKLGVMIGVEGVWAHVINSPDMMRRLTDDLNSPNVGVIFDPVNYINSENYTRQREIIKKHFELLGDITYAVHIKDFSVSDGNVSDAVPGEGIFDFDCLFSEIKASKKEIPMLMETVTEESFPPTAKLLEKLYEHA